MTDVHSVEVAGAVEVAAEPRRLAAAHESMRVGCRFVGELRELLVGSPP